ncbi:MAG: type IV pilus modification protein PilV [Wenzhouxiangella sp.]|nr:type IV pilus modification protein PilV [Wenzhouxiangella sp.]
MTRKSVVNRRQQRGVTLIEVLITVLVVSVGLLGLAALQTFALQSGNTAYQRSQATNVAYEALDFMRANRRPFLEGAGVDSVQDHFTEARILSCLTVTSDLTDEVATVNVRWLDDRSIDGDGDGDCPDEGMLTFTVSSRI